MWWWSLLYILLVISLLVEIAYLYKYRRFRFIVGIIIILYLIVLFSIVIFLNGSQYYPVRSGLFTAIGMIALLCCHVIDLIQWHDEKKHD
jgi:hypothetical protein